MLDNNWYSTDYKHPLSTKCCDNNKTLKLNFTVTCRKEDIMNILWKFENHTMIHSMVSGKKSLAWQPSYSQSLAGAMTKCLFTCRLLMWKWHWHNRRKDFRFQCKQGDGQTMDKTHWGCQGNKKTYKKIFSIDFLILFGRWEVGGWGFGGSEQYIPASAE